MSGKGVCDGYFLTLSPMIITFAALILNIFLNWLLIYGNWGFPAMGLNGAGVATFISRIAMSLAIFWFIFKSKTIGYSFKSVFNFNFSSCVLRTDINPDLLNDTGCFFNVDPQFANIGERNYCPTVGSPAINAGIAIPISPVLIDINGEPRPFGATLPDIGCYETSTE